MASVPALIVGAFFIVVGLLVIPFSLGEGVVIILIGMVPTVVGLAWGVSGSRESSGTGGAIWCPRCGRANGTGSLFCAQCGLYLPLPA